MAGVSDVRSRLDVVDRVRLEIIAGDGQTGVEITRNVRRWVDEQVIPYATELEHAGVI